MNRLVIIGNGFDLAHGLKTSYKDFIRWYFDSIFSNLKIGEERIKYSDDLLKINIGDPTEPNNSRLYHAKEEYEAYKEKPWNFLSFLGSISCVSIETEVLLDRIIKNLEDKKWTDIESDYYNLLKNNADYLEVCISLNKQMDFLRNKLAEYLKSQKTNLQKPEISYIIEEDIKKDDISQSTINEINQFKSDYPDQDYDELYKIKYLMVLDFNYTSTTEKYIESEFINHIHGSLDNPDYMIFGYGDEMDKYFQELVDKDENELLKNSKSIKYLETSSYRKMLEFIEIGKFQVYIMGHSCGTSDRTLLNTIFEHDNCISIKPFYYKWGDDEDTYSEITRNIYRNFKDKSLFRDRVVNKEYCETMPQASK